MVSGSCQIHRLWPNPPLLPNSSLRELLSFVAWWKIYTVKQIRAQTACYSQNDIPCLWTDLFLCLIVSLKNKTKQPNKTKNTAKEQLTNEWKKRKDSTWPAKRKTTQPCLVYKTAESSGSVIQTTETAQSGNEIRFLVAPELFWLFLCIKLQKKKAKKQLFAICFYKNAAVLTLPGKLGCFFFVSLNRLLFILLVKALLLGILNFKSHFIWNMDGCY